MVVIVGAGTLVTSDVINTGIISVSYSLSPSVERLWQLGATDAYDTQITTTKTINITNYGGASNQVVLSPSTVCDDSTTTMAVTIVPAACQVGLSTIDETMWITSYSYSKELTGYGQETWQLTSKPTINGSQLSAVMVEGLAEGDQLSVANGDIVDDQGVSLTGSVVGTSYDAQDRNLSVSAGPTSTGTDDIKQFGIILRIGGGTGQQDGKRGAASATIPISPIYV